MAGTRNVNLNVPATTGAGNLDGIYIDQTLEAVKQIAEAEKTKEQPRQYLGASAIGHRCERSVWYSIQPGIPKRPMSWKGCFAVQDGHRTEGLAIERLRKVPGITIWNQTENGSQIGYTDYDGRIRGHLDGVIVGVAESPKTPHVLEIKTCNEGKFKDFITARTKYGSKQALQSWDYQFYCQALLYMHYMNLTRHYLVVLTPGGRDMASCRTEAVAAHANALIAKSKRLLEAKEPPVRIMEDPAYFVCKFCDFREHCHQL